MSKTLAVFLIERGKLLSPLMVLETLSSSPTITLGMVSSYLTRALEAEKGKIDESERLIEQYSTETDKMKNEIDHIRTSLVSPFCSHFHI